MDKNLTAISLFSGAGGMDIGVQQAGFTILSCLELDKNCCETLRENISRENRKTIVYEGDIKEFAPEHLMNAVYYCFKWFAMQRLYNPVLL